MATVIISHIRIKLNSPYWYGAMIFLLCCSCEQEKTLFKKLDASHTGIDFRNELVEDDQHNILNFTNLYTGSGVGIGDFNGDGLPDIFFGGNQESSRMYLNKGNLQFKDATSDFGLTTDRWITGVSIVDINADGWDDIYLSVSGKAEKEQQQNLLFINQLGKGFSEQAEEYGLADDSQCTHANFFDYDKDGDLDLFLAINPTDYTLYNVNNIRPKKTNGEAASTDKLYRNNRISTDSLVNEPLFTDISASAGILIEGYSLGLNISDINNDHWPDIYITNDFLSNDILYINNQDGTFSNQAADYFKHTSFASMGIDIADINNDGHPEIYVLDMYPEDNFRQKMILGSDNYDRFQYMLQAGYQPQYSRNTLQFNNGDGSFSEIGQLSNIHKTDWSWSPLIADYDNDGYRDLFVTNGFRRDLGDLDYINYNNTDPFGDPEVRRKNQLERIRKQPGAKLPNYAFRNTDGLQFINTSKAWGLDEPSYAHGATYSDLDMDGDLELIVNTVSQEVLIYENQTNLQHDRHFLTIKFALKQAVGTKVWVYYNGQMQYAEYTPYRGYLSTLEEGLHFGLGDHLQLDSILVRWPNGKTQKFLQTKVDQTIILSYNENIADNTPVSSPSIAPLFRLIKEGSSHQEDLQVDFRTQPLLPHQHSRSGPCIAVADINSDGLEDFYLGGSAGFPGQLHLQKDEGNFDIIKLKQDVEKEDTAALFFDADNDGDPDLYVVSGGPVFSNAKDIYQDRLYINTDGVFSKSDGLPFFNNCGGTIDASDYDLDGDLDLFIGGRVSPGKYPLTPTSVLLENHNGTFRDKTPPFLKHIGMLSSCLWINIDEDEEEELILAGEFMPITIIDNQNKQLSAPVTLPNSSGWWNCLKAIDLDQDGDLDLLAGNLGYNSNHKASVSEPLCLYANDFDQNGSIDPVICQFIDGTEYPAASRDKLIQQIPPIKVRFDTYKKYALASIEDVFKTPEKEGMQTFKAQQLASCYIENKGQNTFEIKPLPLALQVAPIQDFLTGDFDQDGKPDALAVGNDYATEVSIGRYDAFQGALLKMDDKNKISLQTAQQTGFKANLDARSLAAVQYNNKSIVIVTNNSGPLQFFEHIQRTEF